MKAWGRTLTRSSLIVTVALGLAGCMSTAGVGGGLFECTAVNEKALKYVNWAKVPEVDIRIRHDEFQPMIVRLRQGWPYVVRIRNRDDRAQAFKANDFFANVAVVKVSIDGQPEDETCFSTVWIPPRKEAEVRLVATTDGYYEFDGQIDLLPGFFSLGPQGIIIVEERRSRI